MVLNAFLNVVLEGHIMVRGRIEILEKKNDERAIQRNPTYSRQVTHDARVSSKASEQVRDVNRREGR